MFPSSLWHQLQLTCIPEPRVLLWPGTHHLLSELWKKGFGDAPKFPLSSMVLAAPSSPPAAQQLLLPDYLSKHLSSIGRIISPGLVEGSRQPSLVLCWTPWWWQLPFPSRREF